MYISLYVNHLISSAPMPPKAENPLGVLGIRILEFLPTNYQIVPIMTQKASTKQDSVANATSGKSSIKSFRYSKKGYCIATLSNGIKGIIGDSVSCNLGTMLGLKGAGIEISYTYLRDKPADDGQVYKQYSMEWNME